jgi:hypothetical protein
MGSITVSAAVDPNLYYNFLVLLNHYFSETVSVGPHFLMSPAQGLFFILCSLISF